MLVLGRGEEEKLRLTLADGRHIWITICQVRLKRVRLGVDAPADVEIMREEILPEAEHYRAAG